MTYKIPSRENANTLKCDTAGYFGIYIKVSCFFGHVKLQNSGGCVGASDLEIKLLKSLSKLVQWVCLESS